MRISDWSSDVCSSDLVRSTANTDFCPITPKYCVIYQHWNVRQLSCRSASSGSIARRMRYKSCKVQLVRSLHRLMRSEENTSELQSLMRISYAVFCLKTNNNKITQTIENDRHKN